MHKGYKINLTLEDFVKVALKKQDVESWLKAAKTLYENQTKEIEASLGKFKTSEGLLNGSLLTAECFPLISADVFISHSHKDLNLALAIAGYLKLAQNIDCFIDSCVWVYADVLLKAIDKEFCLTAKNTYSYEYRNYSTSHVHMMLSVALTRMIYNTECLFFLNTPNSIYPKNSIPNVKTSKDQTLSPWIYTEIEMTKLIKTRSVKEHRSESLQCFSEANEGPTILHEMDSSHLEELTCETLCDWARGSYRDKFSALDALYRGYDSAIYG